MEERGGDMGESGGGTTGASGEGAMSGRVCLVTGATNGIGRETALGLARLGAAVVVHGRDPARTEAAVEEIRSRSGNPDVEPLLADFSALEDVRRAASEFLASGRPLHVLVNNAGVMRAAREVTEDGFEMMFGVNHLAPFLFTNLLLDRLKESAPARVVTVSSVAHRRARIDFDDLQHERGRYRAMGVYGESKLANVLFSYELARRLEGTGVTANCLHPGVVRTGLTGGNHGLYGRAMGLAAKLIGPLLTSPAKGARTSIHAASSPDLDGVTGAYLDNSSVAQSSEASHDEESARRLWEVSAELTGLAVSTGRDAAT